jgi:cytochrome c biogenesis protein
MRTALLLLFLLAVAAVPGSILPQNRADPTRVADYLDQHRIIGPWLNRLGFFDVYSSVWFSAIYLLLFVSLVGCVIPRTRLHWRALRAAPPRTPRRLDRLAAHVRRDAPPDLGPDDVLAAARTVLRRRRYRIAEYGGGEHPTEPRSLGAERGYLAETGNLVFHLALVALLGALAWGSVANYSGQAVVVEQGTFANSVINYDSFSAGTLVDSGDLPPFSLTLTDFLVEFEAGEQASQLGSPREFRATLRVTDRPGADPRTVVVQPNHPLDVDGARVYLVGNGYAPILTVTDGNGDVAFRGPVITTPQDGGYKSLAVVKVPDAKPRQIALVGVFLPTYDLQDGVPVSLFPQPVDPRLMFQVFLAHPGEDGLGFRSGVPQSVMAMNPAQMTRATTGDGQPLQVLMAPGSQVELPDGAGTVRFDALVRYAALDIRHDPSKIWALTTSLLALAGVTASLFVRRRRVWVRAVSGSDGRTVVEVAGLSRDHDATLADEVAAVAESVTKDATRERT